MGDMAKILYHGYYFSFMWGVVSAVKRAICDRVLLLKLAKACNRSLMRTVFLGFTFNAYNACFKDSEWKEVTVEDLSSRATSRVDSHRIN